MDIIQYQKDRDAEVAEFQKSYNDLKVKYSSLLSDAVNEQDPAKQSELVQQILQVNAELSSEVRAFIAQSGQKDGYDPKVLADINNELITNQNQYNEIKHTQDMTTTLANILNEKKGELEGMRNKYTLFIGLLIFAILVVLFFLFRTPSQSIFSTALSESMPPTPGLQV
jgi:hypothetical protein